jgi:hypothetical protein
VKIIVEFDGMEEFEAFRTSGRKARSGKAKDDEPAAVEETAQAIRDAQPLQAPPVPPPPPPPAATIHSFPGTNSGAHPLVAAILTRIDRAIMDGQPADNVVMWFRQQIGPDAKDATLEQIKQVFIPKMSEMQLTQLAPLLGIHG